jgi:hypothetical protein
MTRDLASIVGPRIIRRASETSGARASRPPGSPPSIRPVAQPWRHSVLVWKHARGSVSPSRRTVVPRRGRDGGREPDLSCHINTHIRSRTLMTCDVAEIPIAAFSFACYRHPMSSTRLIVAQSRTEATATGDAKHSSVQRGTPVSSPLSVTPGAANEGWVAWGAEQSSSPGRGLAGEGRGLRDHGFGRRPRTQASSKNSLSTVGSIGLFAALRRRATTGTGTSASRHDGPTLRRPNFEL